MCMTRTDDQRPLATIALALADHCGYQTVAIREMLVSSRPKYFELLGDATQAAVKASKMAVFYSCGPVQPAGQHHPTCARRRADRQPCLCTHALTS